MGRVGSLLRSIEDEMSDMLNRVGMGGMTSPLAPSEVVCSAQRPSSYFHLVPYRIVITCPCQLPITGIETLYVYTLAAETARY